MDLNVAKRAAFQNRHQKAGSGGLGEVKSLARKVSRWHLSGQAGLEGERRREGSLRFDTVTA